MRLFGSSKPDTKKMEKKGDIQGLIQALSNSDPEIRFQAVCSLGRLKANSAIDSIIFLLKEDQDYHVRYSAAGALGELGGTSAVYELMRALDQSNVQVRVGALRALGEIGDPRSVDSVLKCLGDEDIVVHEEAEQVLGELGGRQALKGLLEQASLIREGKVQTIIEEKRAIGYAIEKIRTKEPRLFVTQSAVSKVIPKASQYRLQCFACGGTLEAIEDLGLALQGGEVKCLSCGEAHNVTIFRNSLTLRRVSVPRGFYGPVECTYELK